MVDDLIRNKNICDFIFKNFKFFCLVSVIRVVDGRVFSS